MGTYAALPQPIFAAPMRAPRFFDRLRVSAAVTMVLLLYLGTHGHIPFLMSVDPSGSDTDGAVGLTAQALFLVVSTILTLPYVDRLKRVAWFAAPVLATACLAVLSTAWSQDPAITIRRSIMLLWPTIFALFLHVRYEYQEQLELLLLAGIAAAALSILMGVAFPKVGLDPTMHDGSWQGIFPQKNVCARACVFFSLPAVVMWGRSVKGTLAAMLALLLLGALVYKTHSATGMVLIAVAVLATVSLRFFRKLPANESVVLGVVLIGGAIAGMYLLIEGFGNLLQFLGRDSTLTGRTAIWDGVIEAITKHPVLGYGFAAFWLGVKGESANVVLAARWLIPAAHNGFLDLWLQLGGVGLALFLISLVQGCRAAVWCLRHIGWEAAEWGAAVMLMTVLYNLDETSLLIPRELLWVLYCLAFVNLRVMMAEGRSQKQELVQIAMAEPAEEVSCYESAGTR